MSDPCGPPWARRYARGHRASYANPGLRVSDAERTEVADRLSKHYSEGRLDEAEFNHRLDKAMSAKTRSDLDALFADLPSLPATEKPQEPAVRTHPFQRVIFLILVVVITVVVWHALVHAFVPWLLIGFLAFLLLRFQPWRQHRN